jgi:hypothetical protein
MPRTKRPKPLYQRGIFKLYPRAGRNHEIVWYDETAQRERSVSAGSADVEVAKLALDRRYLSENGTHFCPTCGKETNGETAVLLLNAITDYMIKSEGQAGYKRSTKSRLAHVIRYVAETDPSVTLPAVNEAWIARFRKWLLAKPVTNHAGTVSRDRTLGGVEGCVLQLAAVVNAAPGYEAQFKAKSVKEAAQSPTYRASVDTLAEMFRFCIDPPVPTGGVASRGRGWTDKERAMVIATRENLLRYLRAAVATWSRPDAIYDLKAKGQWLREAGVLNLNPPGRPQTKKFRPAIPVARQFAPCLDEAMSRDNYLPVSTIHHGWASMRKHLGLPGGGEAGQKLIRRSMATICRRIIGEANWTQGEMMLGHRKASISDIYAIPDPANLGLALAATESVIDQIESRVPGAFTARLPHVTTSGVVLKVV